MNRNFLFITVALLVLVVAVGGIIALREPNDRPGVTRANFDLITLGMSRAEVEKIFGGRPPNPDCGYMMSSNYVGDIWVRGDEEFAVIRFDPWQNSTVMEVEWFDFRETPLQKLRRWLSHP